MADEGTKPLESFHCFGRLPAEIRIKVWEYNLPSGRIIELWDDIQHDGTQKVWCRSRNQVPANLHACSESRIEFLKLVEKGKYEHIEFNRITDVSRHNEYKVRRGLYIDYSTDIVSISLTGHIGDITTGFRLWSWALLPVCLKARTLAIECYGHRTSPSVTGLGLLYCLKLLGAKYQEVILVSDFKNSPFPPTYLVPGSELEVQFGTWTSTTEQFQAYACGPALYRWSESERLRESTGPWFVPQLEIDPKYLTGAFLPMEVPQFSVMHATVRDQEASSLPNEYPLVRRDCFITHLRRKMIAGYRKAVSSLFGGGTTR